MKKSTNNTWKRIAAGALSVALVAGVMPANVGGLLTVGKGIEAHAAADYYISELSNGMTIHEGDSIYVSSTDYLSIYLEGEPITTDVSFWRADKEYVIVGVNSMDWSDSMVYSVDIQEAESGSTPELEYETIDEESFEDAKPYSTLQEIQN